jgi:Secretion system C-terminal sorting domain
MKKSYALPILLIGTLLFSDHLYAQFSWRADTPAFPDADLDGHTYTNVGGTPSRDITLSPFSQGSALGWQSTNPRVAASGTSRLLLGVNHTSNNSTDASVSLTMTFSSAVCGLTFSIYEIDRGGASAPYSYVDEVALTATADGGGSVTPTITPSVYASVTGSVITGIGSDGTSSPGAPTTITYSGCVKTLTITYRTGANAQPNPSIQLVSIGDMNWNDPMPVNLLFFQTESQQTGVSLAWRTSEETNNSHFDVEHSTNAQSFEAIGRVGGQGNSDALNNYTFTHDSPRLGINYYRLKQVDFDGKFEYSRIESVYFDGSGSFRVYPNPTSDRLTVELPKDTEVSKLELLDIVGRSLRQFNSREEVSLRSVPVGQYWLRVQTTNGLVLKQMVLKQE